jgi:hypothetical protein
MYHHRAPEDPPDITVDFKKPLIPSMFHQAFAPPGTGQAAAGKKYQQPGHQVDNAQDKEYPDRHEGAQRHISFK